jgi:predicted  nucleic acid-binding Zn-ribbon protein
MKMRVIEIPESEKKSIEQDIREMVGITDEDTPVILDLESVRVIGDGKFEIDLVNVFNTKRPLIYKLEEGKYIIDLASTLSRSVKDLKEIRNPYEKD